MIFYIFCPHSLFIYLINTLSSAQLHCWFDTHNTRTWSWWFCDEPGFWFVSIPCPWRLGSTFPGNPQTWTATCGQKVCTKLHVYCHVNPFWFKTSFECQDRSRYCYIFFGLWWCCKHQWACGLHIQPKQGLKTRYARYLISSVFGVIYIHLEFSTRKSVQCGS